MALIGQMTTGMARQAMKTTTCSGLETVEFDPDDTLDLEITAPPSDDLAAQWEKLADVYADGEICPACMWHESGWNAHTNRRWRECSCFSPDACPGVNPKAIANALKRQAS